MALFLRRRSLVVSLKQHSSQVLETEYPVFMRVLWRDTPWGYVGVISGGWLGRCVDVGVRDKAPYETNKSAPHLFDVFLPVRFPLDLIFLPLT